MCVCMCTPLTSDSESPSCSGSGKGTREPEGRHHCLWECKAAELSSHEGISPRSRLQEGALLLPT